jgi:hypothetical protein
MAEIQVHTFQPFSSRVGIDTVLGLSFRYDPVLISQLKTALHEANRHVGLRHPGGWLAEYKLWFVERCVWPDVRARLLRHGHTVREEPVPPPRPRPQATLPPARAGDKRTAALLEEWAWQMRTNWSDDAAPVIEAGLALLREMLLTVPTKED